MEPYSPYSPSNGALSIANSLMIKSAEKKELLKTIEKMRNRIPINEGIYWVEKSRQDRNNYILYITGDIYDESKGFIYITVCYHLFSHEDQILLKGGRESPIKIIAKRFDHVIRALITHTEVSIKPYYPLKFTARLSKSLLAEKGVEKGGYLQRYDISKPREGKMHITKLNSINTPCCYINFTQRIGFIFVLKKVAQMGKLLLYNGSFYPSVEMCEAKEQISLYSRRVKKGQLPLPKGRSL